MKSSTSFISSGTVSLPASEDEALLWPVIAQGDHVRVRKDSGGWVFKEFKRPESCVAFEALIKLRDCLAPGYAIPPMLAARLGYFQRFIDGPAPSRKEAMRHAFRINQNASRFGLYFTDLKTRNLIVGHGVVFVVDTLAVDMSR